MENNRKEILNYMLKLLQYDTKNTQLQILNLNEPKNDDIKSIQNTVFITYFIEGFVQNLLGIIFSSYDPSKIKLNYHYYYGIHTLKLLKYYCEEHNEKFQSLFYKCEVGQIKNGPFSFIDFLLMTLNKIIIISNWDLDSNDEENDVNYFSDIFHSVIEFLIESVQGCSKENLKSFLSDNSKLLPFIKSVMSFLLNNKSDNKTIYEIKTSVFSLILALLEENNTPKKIAYDIALELLPKKIIGNIKLILKKLYLKLTQSSSHYKKIKINQRTIDFFLNRYYNEEGFAENYEFKLALKMFVFFKIISYKYKVKDALQISNYYKNLTNEDLKFLLQKKFSFTKILKKIFCCCSKKIVFVKEKKKRIEKEHLQIIENHFTLKLFNEIIKTIKIKLVDNEVCSVFFSINPLCKQISTNSIIDFTEKVNRENRYTKLFDLMEYCEIFFNEIKHNLKIEKISSFYKLFRSLNFYWIQTLFYLFPLSLNFLLLLALNSNDEETIRHGNNEYYRILITLNIIQIISNLFILTIWFYIRYPLYYEIELKKYIEANGIKKEKLNILDKFLISIFYSLIRKPEINCYILIVILSIIGIINPLYNVCFGFQLLTIINLSDTLKNIIKAIFIRWSQLFASSAFMGVIIYCFTVIGFFFLNDQFGRTKEIVINKILN